MFLASPLNERYMVIHSLIWFTRAEICGLHVEPDSLRCVSVRLDRVSLLCREFLSSRMQFAHAVNTLGLRRPFVNAFPWVGSTPPPASPRLNLQIRGASLLSGAGW